MIAPFFIRSVLLVFCVAILSTIVVAQQKHISVIAVGKDAVSQKMATMAEDELTVTFRISDAELLATVTKALNTKSAFNLSLDEAKHLGIGTGSDLMLALNSQNLRRSSFQKNVYYESYFVAFLVNLRTGELIAWKHVSKEADDAAKADEAMLTAYADYLKTVPDLVKTHADKKDAFDTSVYEINDASGSTLRTPLPFKKFSPVSTELARSLRVESIVDIEVAIDEKGYITKTRIVRWAGYGLDDEVTNTVRKMNFRPAILNGKVIPARFVLRYNFRIPDPVKN